MPQVSTVPRFLSLSSWRTLNSTLDVIFYDVTALSQKERAMLSAQVSPEGVILIVHPRSSDLQIRTLTPMDFVEEQNKARVQAIDAIVVAGVGSSAIGTAALARNVADCLNRPVAGIVSGFGMADLITEALGGWFIFGAHNALRDSFARVFDAYDLKDRVRDEESHNDIKRHFELFGIDNDSFIYGSPDSTTLLYLLLKLGNRIKLLLGHSKGNYSIENALEGWITAYKKTNTTVISDLCIITLGAVIRFPSELNNVHQFIGQIDLLGMVNSRPALERVAVPGAGHSLNTLMPYCLSVEEALKSAGFR